jgi:SAM-dependent methyltransferase
MDTDKHWKKWGRTDPYYGVVTLPQFEKSSFDRHRDEFFDTCERAVSLVMKNISRFFGAVPHKRVLDFGCGVGRVLIPLAKAFDEAVGADVSQDMLQEARNNCASFGISNAQFFRSDDDLSLVTGDFDLVHSHIVLQHIPIKRGLRIADKLLSKVSDGGFAMLHFSVKRDLSPARRIVYALKHHIPLAVNILNLLQGKAWGLPAMQMNNYPIGEILRTFERRGFTDIIAIPDQHPTAATMHFYARK